MDTVAQGRAFSLRHFLGFLLLWIGGLVGLGWWFYPTVSHDAYVVRNEAGVVDMLTKAADAQEQCKAKTGHYAGTLDELHDATGFDFGGSHLAFAGPQGARHSVRFSGYWYRLVPGNVGDTRDWCLLAWPEEVERQGNRAFALLPGALLFESPDAAGFQGFETADDPAGKLTRDHITGRLSPAGFTPLDAKSTGP